MPAAHAVTNSLRPTGAGYVRYEDTYVSGDTLQQTFNRVTGGKVLTFPEGTFTFSDFANGYYDGVRIGPSGASGCGGIAGSGRGTVFKMVANSSTKQSIGNATSGTNPCFLINVQGTSGSPLTAPVLQNFSLIGTAQGHYYNGIMVGYCNDAVISGLYLLGASPGYANYPPGETFGIDVWHSPRCTLKNTEIDGRDTNGTRTCASPFGWNNTTDAYVYNCYVHHSKAGMPTWWYTVNVTTRNLRSEYNGSGSGQLNGYGLNHENVTGIVRHYNPTLIIDKPGGNSGLHMSLNSSSTNDNDVQIIEPIFDAGPTAGCFSVAINDSYDGAGTGTGTQQQTSLPTVIKNGVTLTGRDANQGTSGADPATQFFRYH
jgi:hypothetical protein